ncbi:MAG: hypothetical protein MZV70_22520 [Desulfobacterales bacterium]|nr:hypothetical protein [Desulfobacterales bacterium]
MILPALVARSPHGGPVGAPAQRTLPGAGVCDGHSARVLQASVRHEDRNARGLMAVACSCQRAYHHPALSREVLMHRQPRTGPLKQSRVPDG